MPHNYNFIEAFITGLSSVQVFLGLFGIAAACAFAVLFATKFGEFILPRPRETRVADFLPFEKLLPDGITIKCHNGTICRYYRVKGADMAFVLPETREAMLEARKSWINTMSEMGITSRVFTQRRRVRTVEKGDHNISLLKRVAFKWAESLNRVYQNEHYIALSVIDRKNAERDLDQASQALQATLADYEITPLYESASSRNEDSPFSFLAELCSPISRPKPKIKEAQGYDLKDMLTADHIHFTGDRGLIRFFSGDREKLCIVMGLRSAGEAMDEQMIADLQAIDCELNILHTVDPIPRVKAMAILMQQRRMATVTSFSSTAAIQYDEVMEKLEESDDDYQTLSKYSLTIFIYGDDLEELAFGESEVERICRLFGATPIREGWAAQASFFAQFPTYEIYPRTYMMLSRAIACAIGLERASEGFPRSDWGEGAITLFKTTSGTAYQWQFHVSTEQAAVAHCCIIGPTGQGKTTLLAFLAGQAMRHPDLRVYFFDRFRGVEIFTRAVGGNYVLFDADEKITALNPFSCRDTSENRAFLRRWLKSITMGDDALAEQEISRAVTTAFEYLKPEERTLANLHKSCFSPTGKMRRELYRWINPEQYGAIFNAQNDDLDMKSRFMAFDFTHIFEDETLAPAVISYITHRIDETTSSIGAPGLIMIDETAPMLKHPMFRDSFIIGLQEGRKKRQAYLCAFQQPNAVDNLGVGEVIRGQCQTVIFFRNPQGMVEDYDNWNLTPKELDFIFGRTFREFPYAILLSRPAIGESVILDVNLGGLGKMLKIYSSGRKNVILARELIDEFGIENFIDKYLERA